MLLNFLPTRIRFNHATHGVHVAARFEGRELDVVIGRKVIERLAGTGPLDQDQSFTAVVRHKAHLEHAAEIAATRQGDDCPAVDVELADLQLSSPSRL
jgi:hypothetical protein